LLKLPNWSYSRSPRKLRHPNLARRHRGAIDRHVEDALADGDLVQLREVAVATIASPETILRWYQELVAKKCDGSQHRGQCRPKTAAEIVALVVRMARENTWGYTRLKGALKNLGYNGALLHGLALEHTPSDTGDVEAQGVVVGAMIHVGQGA
jgi:hypothetical protein